MLMIRKEKKNELLLDLMYKYDKYINRRFINALKA